MSGRLEQFNSEPGEQDVIAGEPAEQKEYNFDGMKEFGKSMTPLVEKLKEKIESGEYEALLSDDAGGRIPTLVLREILKQKCPNKDIQTNFLAGGSQTPKKADKYIGDKNPHTAENNRGYKKLTDYLRKMNFGEKKILVVSQFLHSGETFQSIGDALKDVGVNNFDFAVLGVDSGHDEDQRDKLEQEKMNAEKLEFLQKNFKVCFGSDFFFGQQMWEAGHETMTRWHEQLSGITRKYNKYSPIPEIMTDETIFPPSGVSVDVKNIIKKSREDVKLMAERVIAQVWQ